MPSDYAISAPHALILVENLPVPFDRRVWTEARTLRDAGWQVTVVSPMGDDATRWHEALEGIEVFRYPLPTPGAGLVGHLVEYAVALPASLLLALLVRLRGRIDVVHACNPPDFFFPIGWLLQRTGAAFIFDQHDLGPELYRAQGGRPGGVVDRVLRWAERATYRTAQTIIATNETYRRVALERGALAEENVFVVRTSPDPTRVHPEPAVPELKRGRRWLVAYLGTMGAQDGVDLFLRAAARVANLRPGAAGFVAIGSGDQVDALQQLAADLLLDQDLVFAGRVPDAELRQYLATADVGVSPDPANGFNEYCTMNKTLEYMAMGLPVVAFDLEETRVSAGDAAMYVRPNDPEALGDAIVALLEDPGRRERMSRIGRERIGGPLSWAVSAKRLLAAYRAASLSRRRGG